MSPPSRGRGLKLCARDGPDERHGGRPPSRGRGLKFLDVKDLSAADVSPPLAGAWIEIRQCLSPAAPTAVAPPRGGVD